MVPRFKSEREREGVCVFAPRMVEVLESRPDVKVHALLLPLTPSRCSVL